MQNPNKQNDSNINIEAKILEQEHRLLPVIRNFLKYRKFPNSDPRKKAVIEAAIYRFVFPASVGTTVAFGGTVVGICTLYFLFQQTHEITRQSEFFAKQNVLIESQNSYFQLQNQKLQSQIDNAKEQYLNSRKTELLSLLYEKDSNGQPKNNSKLREVAVVEIISLNEDNKKILSNINLDDTILNDSNFNKSNLEKSSFVNSSLQNCKFESSNLKGADFSNSDLTNASFVDADIWEIKFNKSTLINARFSMSYQSIDKNYLAKELLKAADLSGIQIDPDILDYIKQQNKQLLEPRPRIMKMGINIISSE